MKSINFKTGNRPANAEEWIQGAKPTERESPSAPATKPVAVPTPAAEPIKRLTIDVPATLHTRIKTECARRGWKMADKLREMLEQEFPKS
jgi:hypothetical protein